MKKKKSLICLKGQIFNAVINKYAGKWSQIEISSMVNSERKQYNLKMEMIKSRHYILYCIVMDAS